MTINTTQNLKLPYPDGLELVSLGPTDFQNLAQGLDGGANGPTATRVIAGTLSAIPSAGSVPFGTIYQCTDTPVIFMREANITWQTVLGGTSPPVGAQVDYWGPQNNPVDPDGVTRWFLTNGQAISRSTYATLFSRIGTTYGGGDGSTTFNVPNTIGTTMVTAGSRAGYTSRTVSPTIYGAETVALSVANLPPHNHGASTSINATAAPISDPGHSHQAAFAVGATTGPNSPVAINILTFGTNFEIGPFNTSVAGTGISSPAHGHTASTTTSNTGSGTGVSTFQPSMACNRIIRAL